MFQIWIKKWTVTFRKFNEPKVSPEGSTLRHIIKLTKSKDKERVNSANSRRIATHHIQKSITRPTLDFLSESLQARRQWDDEFKVVKDEERD
jgi:hypothetical protein